MPENKAKPAPTEVKTTIATREELLVYSQALRGAGEDVTDVSKMTARR